MYLAMLSLQGWYIEYWIWLVFRGGCWQVEAMELQWIQKENELAQEKADVRKTAALFKQVTGSYLLLVKGSIEVLPLRIRHCWISWLILRMPGIRRFPEDGGGSSGKCPSRSRSCTGCCPSGGICPRGANAVFKYGREGGALQPLGWRAQSAQFSASFNWVISYTQQLG